MGEWAGRPAAHGRAGAALSKENTGSGDNLEAVACVLGVRAGAGARAGEAS